MDRDHTVYIGNYEISLEDFLIAAEYVMTNTDLKPSDHRLQFMKCVQSMEEVEGYGGPKMKRLKASAPMVFPRYRKIRIIAPPTEGEASEEVRREWVGAKIHLLTEQDSDAVYKVDFDEAVCGLAEKNTEESSAAVKWWVDWRENTPTGMETDFLLFPKEVCELIE